MCAAEQFSFQQYLYLQDMEPTGASVDQVGEQQQIVVETVQPRYLAIHRCEDTVEATVIEFYFPENTFLLRSA